MKKSFPIGGIKWGKSKWGIKQIQMREHNKIEKSQIIISIEIFSMLSFPDWDFSIDRY